MNTRLLASCFLLTPLFFVTAQVFGEKAWTPPRTPDGQPDLQGIWTNATITPLERPAELAGKAVLTAGEAAAYEKQVMQQSNRDLRDAPGAADLARAYNEAWSDGGTKIVGSRRTSLIIDPPDGRVPPLTPGAQRKLDAAREYEQTHSFDGPEDRPLAERCILWPTAGPPMLPGAYNNNYQIFQIPGYVIIAIEMIHDVRVIPLDGRPHLSANTRQWMGDARGHWEGNTLVVETTNFTSKTSDAGAGMRRGSFRGTDDQLRLIERFTRTDPNTIVYQFTIDDPTAFTKPWTAEIPMTKTTGPLYEYSCHEGNYAMTGVLSGARAQEKNTQ